MSSVVSVSTVGEKKRLTVLPIEGTSQIGNLAKNAEGKKRMTVAPHTPSTPTSSIATSPTPMRNLSSTSGSSSMTLPSKASSSKKSRCPPGCISESESARRIAKALGEAGAPPVIGKGQEKYQKKIDKMATRVESFGRPDGDEDILFGPEGWANKKKKKVLTSECDKYSNEPLKCMRRGCKYNSKTERCTGSLPKTKIPKTKKPRYMVVHDTDTEEAVMTQPIQAYNPNLLFAPASWIPSSSRPSSRPSQYKQQMTAIDTLAQLRALVFNDPPHV